jgi:hypothetical protein
MAQKARQHYPRVFSGFSFPWHAAAGLAKEQYLAYQSATGRLVAGSFRD